VLLSGEPLKETKMILTYRKLTRPAAVAPATPIPWVKLTKEQRAVTRKMGGVAHSSIKAGANTVIEFIAFSNEATKTKWEADTAVQAVLTEVTAQSTANGISATGWSTLNVAA
jgi:hypothetical protein